MTLGVVNTRKISLLGVQAPGYYWSCEKEFLAKVFLVTDKESK